MITSNTYAGENRGHVSWQLPFLYERDA